jgi:hypothetical protein
MTSPSPYVIAAEATPGRCEMTSVSKEPAEDAAPGGAVRTVPWFRAVQRFKRGYERLHPSAQMIGLQLWLPLVFAVLFVACYIGAFHSPAPRGVPVGVVGPAAAAREFGAVLGKAIPGGFNVRPVDPGGEQAALNEVRRGDLAALYAPQSKGRAVLTYAAANGKQLQLTVTQTFQGLAAASGVILTTRDVAPLPAADIAGTVPLYVSLVGTIAGYMVGMFTGMMGGPLKRRTRWGILAGASLVLSLLVAVLAEFAVGALSGHFWALWATVLCTSVAVGLVVDGLGYYLNRFVTGAALVLFVFLNIPSSGGAIPVDLVPEPFHWLSHVVIGDGVIAILRDVFYGAGPGLPYGIWRLAAYAAAGLLLALAGPHYAAWRYRRRSQLGLPVGGMMGHAQYQLMSAAAARAAADHAPSEQEESSGSAAEAEAVIEEAGEFRRPH